MAEGTHIEWCDSTFNPWLGCTKLSMACDHCYAEAWANRYGQVEWGNAPRKLTSAGYWRQPLKWQRDAAAFAAEHGRRRRVFCASLADVFDNQVDPEWRVRLWTLIAETPDLDWLLLTKRPQNITKMLPPDWGKGWPNVWLGTTIENQEEADRRIPEFLAVPAVVHFLSCEPLLGPLQLRSIRIAGEPHGEVHNPLSGYSSATPWGLIAKKIPDRFGLGRIDWVIAGGESGPEARPSHPDWFRELRDQCAAAYVPFLFKQWGEFVSVSEVAGSGDHFKFADGATVRKIGKKAAGRLLDGIEHNAFPGVLHTAIDQIHEIPGELEFWDGKLTKVINPKRYGWARFMQHYDGK
jgi:protein gp37